MSGTSETVTTFNSTDLVLVCAACDDVRCERVTRWDMRSCPHTWRNEEGGPGGSSFNTRIDTKLFPSSELLSMPGSCKIDGVACRQALMSATQELASEACWGCSRTRVCESLNMKVPVKSGELCKTCTCSACGHQLQEMLTSQSTLVYTYLVHRVVSTPAEPHR